MQRFSVLFLQDALHGSGGISAHHQEHLTVHTTSGICRNLMIELDKLLVSTYIQYPWLKSE